MLNPEQQILEQIKKSENILITFPGYKGGDAIASALALNLALSKMGKKSEVVSDLNKENTSLRTPNESFSFLPKFQNIKNQTDNLRNFVISLNTGKTKVKKIKYKTEEDSLQFLITPEKGFFSGDDVNCFSTNYKYDLIITLDAPDLESLGKIYENDPEFFYETPIINIDHSSDNESFGQINKIELTAVSIAEILFSVISNYSGEIIDEDIATCLLAGMIYKTKSFKTLNITPNALQITSKLLSMGARRDEIINKLYRSRNIHVLKLWGRVLARLSGLENNKIIWSTLSVQDFEKTECGEKDLADIIDELIGNIPQVKIIMIFYELPGQKEGEKKTKAVAYSTKNINLIDLFKPYSFEGNEKMIMLETDQGVIKTRDEIVQFIKNRLNTMNL